MTILEQIQNAIEEGNPGETEKLVRQAVNQHISAARIVEEAMTPAMRTVGENYRSKGADIIRILAAAPSVRALNFWKSRMGSLTGEIWEL